MLFVNFVLKLLVAHKKSLLILTVLTICPFCRYLELTQKVIKTIACRPDSKIKTYSLYYIQNKNLKKKRGHEFERVLWWGWSTWKELKEGKEMMEICNLFQKIKI